MYYVYILSSRNRTIYTGVTNSLTRRSLEHKGGAGSRFTSRYKVNRLIHYEEYSDVKLAIARERQIKGWRRSKKVKLIEETNPRWIDLCD